MVAKLEAKNSIKRFPISITVCFLLAIIGIAALSLLLTVKFWNPSAIYGESCADKPCSDKFGLECIDNYCKCNKDTFYRFECILKKTVGQKCHNISSPCNQDKNLICVDGFCKCNDYSYWNNEFCNPKQNNDEPCQSSDIQCLQSKLLYCDVQQKKCKCSNDRYYVFIINYFEKASILI